MRKTFWDPHARERLLERLDRLTPDAKPRWGKMSPVQMLAHLADWISMASGDIATSGRRVVLRHPPLKQLAIYWLPFPKGVPTSPELLSRAPSDWNAERTSVRERVEAFEKLSSKTEWPAHPVFGEMTPRAWGVFAYRHMDHHLRQFGV